MRPDSEGEIIISNETLNNSTNLRVDSPMQHFYGVEVDWLLDHQDNMDVAMDLNDLAINTSQLWITNLHVSEGMRFGGHGLLTEHIKASGATVLISNCSTFSSFVFDFHNY